MSLSLTGLLTLIAAILTAVFLAPNFVKEFLSFFIKPKLQIEFELDKLPDLYAPVEEIVSPEAIPILFHSTKDQPQKLIRKSIKVVVRNIGRGVAERCKAELILLKCDSNKRLPSKEPKQLLWNSGEVYHDLNAKGGYEPLYVVLSDTRLPSTIRDEPSICGLIATPDTVRMTPPMIRAQDGFGEGSLEVEVVVTSKNGDSVSAKFKIQATQNWLDLRMERIS